ncbi:MAG: hypothetical protein P4L83_00475 [Nevskia sp.]|nr:hypothetical protein [Nevskia sp.]
MLVIIGSIVVLVSVVGGFVLSHGHLLALWQPYELLIIGGAAFGSFLTSNPPKVVKEALAGGVGIMRGPRYKRGDYLDILSLTHEVLSKIRKQGMMSIEDDIEDPSASPLFSNFPKVVSDHHLTEFMTDCLRLMVTGNMNPHELEPLLEAELETHHHESLAPAHALAKLADALPGFGIVAAVLGIVTTMASIGGEGGGGGGARGGGAGGDVPGHSAGVRVRGADGVGAGAAGERGQPGDGVREERAAGFAARL